MLLDFTVRILQKSSSKQYRVPSGQGKPGKPGKGAVFRKKSGKTWKSQGIFIKFLKSQGKVRELFSRMSRTWCFQPIWESLFSKFFLSDPTMVGPPNYHDLTTKTSTVFFTIIWKQFRFWSGKNGLFWCWVREKLQYFSTFVKEKGLFLNQKSGKIILGNCWEPCFVCN